MPQGKVTTVRGVSSDPAHYPAPEEFRLDRVAPRDHFAFHFGPHTCVGAALARAELAEAVKAMVERLPDMRLTQGAQQPAMKGWLVRSYAPLQISFTPGKRLYPANP